MRSQEFTVHRVVLARMTAEAYVRLFWWFILPGPLFGIVLLIMAPDPTLKAIGALGCVWPATIPLRAYLSTAKLAKRLYSHPTTVVAMDQGLLFLGATNSFKARYDSLRNAYVRHGMIVINTKRYAVLLIPISAFECSGRSSELMKTLAEHGVRVNEESFLEVQASN
jgi:hypothetical protein